jgi:hypothetical protein
MHRHEPVLLGRFLEEGALDRNGIWRQQRCDQGVLADAAREIRTPRLVQQVACAGAGDRKRLERRNQILEQRRDDRES